MSYELNIGGTFGRKKILGAKLKVPLDGKKS